MTYNEKVLEDNYPTHYGYLYVIGMRVFKNIPDFKTVGEMRKELVNMKLEEPDVVIKSCDIIGRELQHLIE